VKIDPKVRPERVPEKRPERTVKKSQRRYISPTWGEASTEPICIEICTVVAVAEIIKCATFWTEIFRGYGFTWSRISGFPTDSCMGLTTVQISSACDNGLDILST